MPNSLGSLTHSRIFPTEIQPDCCGMSPLKKGVCFCPQRCDTQNAQDAVSPSQHSPGKSPVPLPSTSKDTLSGPVRSCDTQNAQDTVSPSQHSPGKSPVPLPGTSEATLPGPARSCDTQNAQDAVSPSQPSPGKSPVLLPSTSNATLSGPARSCDTQNAQDAVSPSQLQIPSKIIHQTLQNFWRFLNLNSVSRGQN